MAKAIVNRRGPGRPKVDLTGKRFGRLIVLGLSEVDEKGARYWRCQCTCPKETVLPRIAHTVLQREQGGKRHCGCQREEHFGCMKKALALADRSRRLTPEEVKVLKAQGREESLTRTQLAKQFGVSRKTVASVLDGASHKRQPGEETLPRTVQDIEGKRTMQLFVTSEREAEIDEELRLVADWHARDVVEQFERYLSFPEAKPWQLPAHIAAFRPAVEVYA